MKGGVLLQKPGSSAFPWGVGGSPGVACLAALGPSRPGVWVLCAGFGVYAVQLALGSCILNFWSPPPTPCPQASVCLGTLGLGVQPQKLGIKADGQHGRLCICFWVWGTHSGRGCWAACWPLSSQSLSRPVTPASVSPPSPLTPDLRIPVSSWINLPSSSGPRADGLASGPVWSWV